MSLDYNLVIISNVAIARDFAWQARQWNARVALVEPPAPDLGMQQDLVEIKGHHLLLAQQTDDRQNAGSHKSSSATIEDLQFRTRLGLAVSQRSIGELIKVGIDVVVGTGEFYRRPTVGLTINGRKLRSQAYLLLFSPQRSIPHLAGLSQTQWTTPEALTNNLPNLPDRVLVLGSHPDGLSLAQVMNRLGSNMTIAASEPFFSAVDPEITQVWQLQQYSEGIDFLDGQTITQIQPQINQSIQVNCTDDRSFTVDQILLNTSPCLHLPDHINLEAIGLANVDPLKTSLHTRSRSAHIHAALPESIQTVEQRDRLLRKIWGLPNWRSSRVTDLSFFVPTLPPILSFGETEQTAQQKYGDSLIIIRSPYYRLAAAKLTEQESGLCKLIAHPNGRLLGLHWYGAGAAEAQGWLAQLWQQSPSLKTIAQLPVNDGSFVAILSQAAQDWKMNHSRQSTWQNGLRETYFNALRDWLS